MNPATREEFIAAVHGMSVPLDYDEFSDGTVLLDYINQQGVVVGSELLFNNGSREHLLRLREGEKVAA